jgi:uncharacterized membrane protein
MRLPVLTIASICVFLLFSSLEMKNRFRRFSLRNTFILTILYASAVGASMVAVVSGALLHKIPTFIALLCFALCTYSLIRVSKAAWGRLNH